MVYVRLPDQLVKRGQGCAVRLSGPKKFSGTVEKKEVIRGLATRGHAQTVARRDESPAEIRETVRQGEAGRKKSADARG